MEKDCPVCDGSGVIPNPKGKNLLPPWFGLLGWLLGWLLSKDDRQDCPNCNGKGKITLPPDRK